MPVIDGEVGKKQRRHRSIALRLVLHITARAANGNSMRKSHVAANAGDRTAVRSRSHHIQLNRFVEEPRSKRDQFVSLPLFDAESGSWQIRFMMFHRRLLEALGSRSSSVSCAAGH